MHKKTADEKIPGDLSELNEEDFLEKERRSKIKRTIITVVGIILGILIVTNLVFTFPIIDLIYGQIVSNQSLETQ